jgi:hypothetical protein
MTAQELFNHVVGIMGQVPSNAQTYLDVFLPNLNAVLAQSFKLENNNREYYDLAILTTIPKVTTLSDVLTYQDNILYNVVSWGIAQQLALSDDDVVKTGFYSQQYAEGLINEAKMIKEDIVDYYSLESEE